jgi:DNA polymerase-3 subunit alpha
MAFAHLHTHSHYSLLQALGSPGALVNAALEQGVTAVALTDIDAMYGAIPFYKACKEKGVHPILGLEVHVAPEGRLQKRSRIDKNTWRLVLLAENLEGYGNLLKLSSIGYLEGFYYTARVDDEVLAAHAKGLIAFSGCMGSELAALIEQGNTEKAEERARFYRDLFGPEHFFLELVHRRGDAEQDQVNAGLVALGERTGIPLVATNNAFYRKAEDHEAWETLQGIQKGVTLEEFRRMSRAPDDMSLRSPEEIAAAFAHVPDALANAERIADRCKVDLVLDTPRLPIFEVPGGKSDTDFLRELSEAGLVRRYGTPLPAAVAERFAYEYSVIVKMGFASYFLIVQDFVNKARELGVIVGPGRGSAAGSIVAYALGITDLDPLAYNLLFERFLNPDRVSMPDIDMDFQDNKRALVLDYVSKKYGADHVAGIITFGTMMPKAAVRDAARVLGLSFQEGDRIAKAVPNPVQGRHVPLAKAVVDVPELKAIYEEPLARRVLDLARAIEGTPRHASQHACGIVISDRPLTTYVPLQESQHDDLEYVSQYSLNPVESAGLVKMDFLGLSNLSIIGQTLEIVEAVHGVKVDIDHVPLTDVATYELLGRGETVGVFQFESEGMQRYLSELRPTEFEDIVAMGALYRPGPLSAGMVPQYINRKHGRENVVYDHPLMEPILNTTYGVTVYQEQIMRLSQALAGFTAGEADTLRKAMGKKKREVLEKMKEKFISGCVGNHVTTRVAEKVWHDWEGFADYAFNKSHSACYGLISYRTAYLKAHYPAEFMASVLNADAGLIDRMTVDVSECTRMKLHVLPPDVNESFKGFGVVGARNIRWGLMGVKNVGEEMAAFIVSERKQHGPYADLSDFVRRMDSRHFNKKALEALGKAGAFDAFVERGTLVKNIDAILDYHRHAREELQRGQLSLFAVQAGPLANLRALHLTPATPASRSQRLAWERELLGIYVSEHPFTPYAEALAPHTAAFAALTGMTERAAVRVAGAIADVREILTKKQECMAFVKVERPEGELEVVFFPRTYGTHKADLVIGTVLVVSGKISQREDRPVSVLADSVAVVNEETAASVVHMLETGTWVGEEVERSMRQARSDLEEAGLLIRFTEAPGAELMAALRSALEQRKGTTTLFLEVPVQGGFQRVKTSFSVAQTPALITTLQALLPSSAHCEFLGAQK